MRGGVEQRSVARGASVAKTGVADKGHAWWQHHQVSASGSLARILRTPLHSLMTALVVAIALALPTSLFVMLENVYRLGDSWDSNPKLSVYLKLQSQPQAITALQETLSSLAEVKDIQYISPEQALQQFQEHSGFAGAIDLLDENPLPPTLIVTPSATQTEPEQLEQLHKRIALEPLVDEVVMDMEWVKKLKAMMALGQKAVLGLAMLLGLGVLLAIGNTIRLEIENRRDEIVVIKLVGGTNGFVRRPLLYTGLWYGILGAVLGCILVTLALFSLSGPVAELATAYQGEFNLQGLGLLGAALLLFGGGMLGLLGAWLAVARHLSAIEPR